MHVGAFLKVGFFEETSHGTASLPMLRDCIAVTPQQNEDKILAYLRNGVGVSGCGEYIRDVLDPASRPSLPVGVYTDGVYAWPANLDYYVEKYHARMPADFVAHMRSNNWLVPDDEDLDLEN